MRLLILIFITAIINLGDGRYWKDLRSTKSMTKPYKGHTLGKEMFHKLKQNNQQRNRELKIPKGPGQGPLKSLYLKSGYRHFPGGGVGTGDNEREIDGDISLVDSRRRAPFIMPLQYTRAGGKHGHGHKGHKHKGHEHKGHGHKGHEHKGHEHKGHGHSKRPHHKKTTTTTTPTPITTTQCSKKRTKFNYKEHFGSRAWGRTNASTPPPTPKRTIYTHWTPDFIGTDVNQWTWMQYSDNPWVVQPIWEEGHTPTDHYLEMPTDIPELYVDVSLKPNLTRNVTNDTDTDSNETDSDIYYSSDEESDNDTYSSGNDTYSSGNDTDSSGNDTDSNVNATVNTMPFLQKALNFTLPANSSIINWGNLDKPSANKSDQELLDLWATQTTKPTRQRTTKTHRTRAANETSAEKVSYLSTIKTYSTPHKRHSSQATYFVHYRDWIHDHDKRRVQRLAEDLMKDAVVKIQQVTGIKDECMHATAFEVGYVIGIIREKYRRMMATYTEIMDRIRQRTRLLTPNNNVHEIRPYHLLIYYEWIHNLEKDIDYLLDALEDIPIEELGVTEATISFRAKAQEEVEAREIMNIRAQDKLKSQYRQEFLMRRLGLPRNMSTARRRFHNKWPVEETWDHTPLYW